MKTNEDLVAIYNQTLNAIQVGGYECLNGNWVDLEQAKTGTRFYKTLKNTKYMKKKLYPKTLVYVQNIDTFQKAKELGPGCAVLNMASFVRAGGGVAKGSRAQEEDLCRRSNLLQSLYMFDHANADIFGYRVSERYHYPIPTYGGIYTPNVTVFRHALSYNYLEEPYKCAVISVPGIKNPEKDARGCMTEKSLIVMKGKIRAILRIAIINGHGKLVLGALSCGAYRGVPSQIAMAFKEVLEEDEFQFTFEEICFAILEDANSLKNADGGNLKPFLNVFGPKPL